MLRIDATLAFTQSSTDFSAFVPNQPRFSLEIRVDIILAVFFQNSGTALRPTTINQLWCCKSDSSTRVCPKSGWNRWAEVLLETIDKDSATPRQKRTFRFLFPNPILLANNSRKLFEGN